MSEQTVAALLEAIAAKQPTPGGGAVAALTLALGAALCEMVLNYSQGKKALAEFADAHTKALADAQAVRARALDLADADAHAYEALSALTRRKDDPALADDYQRAVRDAIEVPMEVLQLAVQLAELLRDLTGKTNKYLGSDLAMAAILAEAAAQSACWNIHINVPELASESDRTAAIAEMNDLSTRVKTAATQVLNYLRK